MNLLSRVIGKKDLQTFREFVTFLATRNIDRPVSSHDVWWWYQDFKNAMQKQNCRSKSIREFISLIHEMFRRQDHFIIMQRLNMGKYRFYTLRVDGEFMEEIHQEQYLDFKDYLALGEAGREQDLVIDYLPFYDYTPTLQDPGRIGRGVRYLNRYLSSRIFSNPDKWRRKLFEFIKLHQINGKSILINGELLDRFAPFHERLRELNDWLKSRGKNSSLQSVQKRMKSRGFESGWGNSVERIRHTTQLLLDLFSEPTGSLLEEFINHVPAPLISKIAIVSPHGWFAQENVIGKPDTGGQVIYILDQVKALEKYLQEEIAKCGLKVDPRIIVVTRYIPNAEGTACNIRKEKIYGTDHSYILRIPFKDAQHNILKDWISRFKVWPYLEQFSRDAATQVISEFQGKPDLIIGNYSDGNLVASLLSSKLNVIQCTIAHALEKTKYPGSDLYWERYEQDYHFSLQYIADIISMNKSDFIITSTFQEIFGTETDMGQYESYQFFTLPGLVKITGGINLYAPKFNVIPPGVDEGLYFPYYETDRRSRLKTGYWEDRLFTGREDGILGRLAEPGKTPIFTMARFDKVKNITGLIEAFGLSQSLQKSCNLIFAGGSIDAGRSDDLEEQAEIQKAHSLIEKYRLEDKIRWLPSIKKMETGEVYRVIADRKGIFVQPALFEAFGLTILEAMLSGLPTFGPQSGGPSEIIEDQKNGILVDTSNPRSIARRLEKFFRLCKKDPRRWEEISRAGIHRVREFFTWRLYSKNLIDQTKLYGFWRYSVSGEGRVEMDRYTDLIYHFLLKQRARRLL